MAAEQLQPSGEGAPALSGDAPPAKRRKPDRRRIATRRAITTAASELFAEQGADATTVDEIAARAGLSVGTLYFHYGSKEGVALALIERVIAAADAALADARAEGSALDRLLRVGDLYLRFALEQPVAFRFVADGFINPAGDRQEVSVGLGQRIDDRVGHFIDAVRSDLAEAMDAGDLDRVPLDEAVALVWGTWNGVAALTCRNDRFAVTPDVAQRALARGRSALIVGLGGTVPAALGR